MFDRYQAAPVLDHCIVNVDEGITCEVRAGLLYSTANPMPYFSLSFAERAADGTVIRSGAWTEQQRDLFPEFDDLFELIGCDLDGVPPHVELNGWYWLGMSPEQFFVEERVAQHFRIEPLVTHFLRSEIMKVLATPTTSLQTKDESPVIPMTPAWEFYLDWVAQQRPRWKADAESVIKAHDLVVFGDLWEG